jgi:magnesium transporter
MAGVSADETVLDSPRKVYPRRLVWLLINLGTAILASSVIGLFEASIQAMAALAVFMPIVASMGGISTTQTATVVIRGLAIGDMTLAHIWPVLRKELMLGLLTGTANAVVMAVIAYLWKGQLLLSVILGAALVLNMLVAAVVGTTIPLILKQLRLDPAIASSVVITTFTDVCGFFSYLGLATLLIRGLL